MGLFKGEAYSPNRLFSLDLLSGLDMFLLAGGTIKKVVDQYTELTGRPALLPKRAMGYQGSSMYYPELEKDSDDAVLNFIDTVH